LHSQLYIPPPGPAPLGRADGQNQAVRIWPAGERRGEVRRVKVGKVKGRKVKERKVKEPRGTFIEYIFKLLQSVLLFTL
jgi:hypothetical protein